jgi:hypothetical protein
MFILVLNNPTSGVMTNYCHLLLIFLVCDKDDKINDTVMINIIPSWGAEIAYLVCRVGHGMDVFEILF